MKTNLLCKISSIIHAMIFSRPCPSRLRLAAAGTLFLAAAGLAATAAMHPPKLPWAVPTVRVGHNPVGTAVDPATNTVYVADGIDTTLSVIDGSKCNAMDSSGCSTIATVAVGRFPLVVLFDSTTKTLYVTLSGGHKNTISVVDTRTCNAQDTSGCSQARVATVTVPGVLPLTVPALDAANHSLYVGDGKEGPVSIVDTAICNATNTSGCSQPPVVTATKGDSIAIDHSNHSIYVTNAFHPSVSVFDGTTCNAIDQSTCAQPPAATFTEDLVPLGPAVVDETTHTYYLPLASFNDVLDYVAVIDASTCNGTITSGCRDTPPMVQVGDLPEGVILDPETKTVYVLNEESSTISMFNGATCNAMNHSGCSQLVRALTTGFNPVFYDLNLQTHTFYVPSQDTDRVWVLDASTCNATNTSGCTKFAPATVVGAAPVGIEANPNTKTVYVANQTDNTVSVIDTNVCNKAHPNDCNQAWTTIAVGSAPRSLAINRVTNTIYVPNRDDGTVSVIDGDHCNGMDVSGCGEMPATTAVGTTPQEVAVDETTNTIYVVNQDDDTVSVIDGAHCNGMDTSGCNQSWPTVTVGASPQALAVNPNNHTVYVANTDDNTVSVIDGNTAIATIAVGAGPRSIGIVLDKNTLFVGNRSDMTVSVIDGSTCNGGDTTGCGQMPPAILVGAFPKVAGNVNYILGRRIAVDQDKHTVFIPIIGDSDVATLDGNTCNASHPNNCRVTIVPKRMGGWPVFATVDESSGTVYVSDNVDGTVSLFPSSP
jgi:YVTN family beta-propeller protein